ncbi:MAG: hypothetical protein ACTTJL_09305, partial [Hoylesella enoeca]|uniref:hypothetical protein n=1 Tax=Hoylesella enoeca TaxID=76123 RepID=UPI003F9EDF68
PEQKHARNSVSTHFPNKNMLETVYLLTSRTKTCRKQCIYSLPEQKHARNSVSTHFPNKNMLETVYLITFRAKSCWKQRFFDEFSDRHIMNIPKGIEPKGRRKNSILMRLTSHFNKEG